MAKKLPIMTSQDYQAYQRVTARNDAVRLLQHYMRAVWTKAGLRWDADQNAEIEALIDAILTAAATDIRVNHG